MFKSSYNIVFTATATGIRCVFFPVESTISRFRLQYIKKCSFIGIAWSRTVGRKIAKYPVAYVDIRAGVQCILQFCSDQ